ncbi:MAG: 5-formyltetrahydrofolate cyclo-ligase [Eubacterium sp.]|nr:5-formyltetrahydrofolate cyclo-ligase [Eubacterium sp.]
MKDQDQVQVQEKHQVEVKRKVRSFYKSKRDKMPDLLAQELSLKISRIVLASEWYQHARLLFFYYPLGREVSLLPVIHDALRQGKRAAFPKTIGERMEFFEITDLCQLEEGCFHVMEPDAEGKKPVSEEPDLCFVPGTVFDKKGGRLGYGRGYYDRYFAEKNTAMLVGCAYGFQIVDELCTDAWDVRMDVLLSENGAEVLPPV